MPGTPTLEAFNAKARQSTAGSRKKGKVKKSQTNSSFSRDVVAESDPNAEILAQKSQKDKDQEKKEKLLREVFRSFFSLQIHVLKTSNFSSPYTLSRNGQAKRRGGWKNIL